MDGEAMLGAYLRHLLGKSRLPDSRLAPQQREAASPGQRPVGEVQQVDELTLSTDEGRISRHVAPPSRMCGARRSQSPVPGCARSGQRARADRSDNRWWISRMNYRKVHRK